MIEISVAGQRMTIADGAEFVQNSVNVYECNFTFDSAWDGFAKTAVFRREAGAGDPIEVPMTEDQCTVPHGVLESTGRLRIGVYGVKDDVVYPTVWGPSVYIQPGTPTQGATEDDIDQTQYTELRGLIQENSDAITDLQDKVVPPGGSYGQALIKMSDDTDNDATWTNVAVKREASRWADVLPPTDQPFVFPGQLCSVNGPGASAYHTFVCVEKNSGQYKWEEIITNRAQTQEGIAIGKSSEVSGTSGIAIGSEAVAGTGIAIGPNAESFAQKAIQIGEGTNNSRETVQLGEYRILESDGMIPNDRMMPFVNLAGGGAVSLKAEQNHRYHYQMAIPYLVITSISGGSGRVEISFLTDSSSNHYITYPSNLLWPVGLDPTNLQSNTRYDIAIRDSTYVSLIGMYPQS